MSPKLREIKDRSPRWVKDAANYGTRRYGVWTAGSRPLPDFLIIGTKRGGTTSLWNNLLRHPQVAGMWPAARGRKSSDFFFSEWDQSLDWFRSHFTSHRSLPAADGGSLPVLAGEASPYYMYGPDIPQRMSVLVPDVRLVVLLRDPVERAFSHYQERRQEGVEPLTFGEALAAEPERLSVGADTTPLGGYDQAHDFYSYRDRGLYLPQIKRLHQYFASEQVLILRSEDFYEDYQRAFDGVCEYLGIPRLNLGRAEHHNSIPRSPMSDEVREDLSAFYRAPNAALEDYLGREFGWQQGG